ncbi:RNA polymerase sigma-70 factor, sigma-E family [Quadrisphaera granulorum]|uniref:RNA polymerase sigma-70 factor (Sigma-E family) n=1 Tax=Quadrisphaera granulorum TaxID=317664 RepID=A0A316AAI8_9ACTN|nr:SigE family RNA polymerase sigma factor [Quadrisphaera granulorum]PWJ54562.1 RNA polymerase sigma-70 factor (sigma-E family) [Quadrisphaera granulorum]SZE95924.1 RNA polymerase sigma-70 factor, sigma-E family [Quadrisphaera granulorum]
MGPDARSAEESFDEFAAFALPRLRRVAYAYCQDWHRSDDAVQGALERVYSAWSRVRSGDAYGYTRTTLVRLLVSEGRRPWRRHEVTTDDLTPHEHSRRSAPASTGHPPPTEQELFALLADLSPGQRAVVVLRYFEHLSVAETARTLGCSEGTVKSQTHAARQALRELLTDPSEQGAPR